MLIYNITFNMEREVGDEGLSFLKNILIPGVVNGGKLFNPRLCRVQKWNDGGEKGYDSEEGDNYALQFNVPDNRILTEWLEMEGAYLLGKLPEVFGDRITGFATILEVIDTE